MIPLVGGGVGGEAAAGEDVAGVFNGIADEGDRDEVLADQLEAEARHTDKVAPEAGDFLKEPGRVEAGSDADEAVEVDMRERRVKAVGVEVRAAVIAFRVARQPAHERWVIVAATKVDKVRFGIESF